MDSWISIIHLDPIHIYHLLYGFNWIGSYNPWTIYMKPIMICISILPPLVLAHKTIACGLYSLKWLLYCTWASFLSLRLSFLSEIYLKFGSTGIKRRLWLFKLPLWLPWIYFLDHLSFCFISSDQSLCGFLFQMFLDGLRQHEEQFFKISNRMIWWIWVS